MGHLASFRTIMQLNFRPWLGGSLAYKYKSRRQRGGSNTKSLALPLIILVQYLFYFRCPQFFTLTPLSYHSRCQCGLTQLCSYFLVHFHFHFHLQTSLFAVISIANSNLPPQSSQFFQFKFKSCKKRKKEQKRGNLRGSTSFSEVGHLFQKEGNGWN